MSDSDDDVESETLTELDNDNFILDPSSIPTRLQFQLTNTLGDASISLANVCVKVPVDEAHKVKKVYLSALSNIGHVVIGTSEEEKDDTFASYKIEEWQSVPLPLGGNFHSKLSLVVHTDGKLSPSYFMFRGDIVMTPEIFLENSPKIKREMNGSIFRVYNGFPKSIEFGKDAMVIGKTFDSKALFDEKEASWMDGTVTYRKSRPILSKAVWPESKILYP